MSDIIIPIEIDLKLTQDTKELPKLSEKVLEMGELVIRTYLGMHVPDFTVAETEIRMPNPVTMVALYRTAMNKTLVARFAFFDFDDVIVEGGLVENSVDRKAWVFSCSSGFLTKNYPVIKKALDNAGVKPNPVA